MRAIVRIRRRFLERLLRRGVAQLVARMVWDHEVRGSSPRTPTCIVGDPIGISISGSNSVVEFLPSKQAVAGSSPVSRSTETTVSLGKLHTLFEDKQAVMKARAGGFVVCENASSDYLPHFRCDHLPRCVRDHLPHRSPHLPVSC